MNEWVTKVYNDFDEQLETVWKKLQTESDHFIFQSFEWIYHWQQTIGHTLFLQPVIITVSFGDQVVALFPLVIRRVFGIKVLEFLGGEHSDYNSPLIINEFLTKDNINIIWSLVKNLLPAHDVVAFLRLPQFIANKENYFCASLNAKEVSFSSFALMLPRSIKEFRLQIPKKIRSDNNRQIRRLKKEGTLSFRESQSKKEYEQFVDSMILQKRFRCQTTGVRDLLSQPSVRNFYKHLEIPKGSEVKIHLSALMLNKTILSTHWGAIYRNRFYFLMPSFSAEWGRYSPGKLLLMYLIEWSIEQELEVFDFSVGAEDYKKNFCNQEMKIFEHTKSVSLFGLTYLFIRNTIFFLKTTPFSRQIITSLIANIRKIKSQLS